MRITWSIPIPGETLGSSRGDLVRALRLVEGLRAEGHDVCVVEAGSRSGAKASVSAYRSVMRRLLPSPLALAIRDVGRVLHAYYHGQRVASAAMEHGSELIIETQVHFTGSGARAARLTGIPLLLDDCSPSREEDALNVGLPWLSRVVFRRQLRAASALVVPSEVLSGMLVAEGASPDIIHVVPNGVDVNVYEAIDRAASRKRFGLDDRPVIGFIGSFQPWHRIDLLLGAIAEFDDDQPFQVLLVGEGEGREPALALARRLGLIDRVIAPGALHPDEIPIALSACDVGVLPGTMDYGHPMKLAEYAAARLPTIAPDFSTVRKALGNGAAGMLFPPDDVTALSQALLRLLRDEPLRQRLGSVAYDIVAREALWKQRAQTLIEVASTINR